MPTAVQSARPSTARTPARSPAAGQVLRRRSRARTTALHPQVRAQGERIGRSWVASRPDRRRRSGSGCACRRPRPRRRVRPARSASPRSASAARPGPAGARPAPGAAGGRCAARCHPRARRLTAPPEPTSTPRSRRPRGVITKPASLSASSTGPRGGHVSAPSILVTVSPPSRPRCTSSASTAAAAASGSGSW